MKLTIGLPSFNNYVEVWFTVQALRLYQDLTDTEVLILDNAGDDNLKRFVEAWGHSQVRYVRYTESQGPFAAKGRIFVEALGEWVMVIDSHVMLAPGAVKQFRDWVSANGECMDLLQGPMLYDDLKVTADSMEDEWRGHMWGIWHTNTPAIDAEPYEIQMHGMGLFACRRDAWLGFNPAFRGFGGEEGYIHEKYRKAGRKTMLLPFLRWNHYFRPTAPPFAVTLEDRIHNYQVGLSELGIDQARMKQHFNI